MSDQLHSKDVRWIQRFDNFKRAYRRKMKKVSPDTLAETRFVFFFQKHRQCGIEQTYQKVV